MWETLKSVALLVGLLSTLTSGKLPPDIAIASLMAGVTLHNLLDAARRRRVRQQWGG